MDLYTLLCLIASEISILLGLSVFFLNRKSIINRLFMFAMFANAYWAFCTFMKTTTGSIDTAFLWSKALSFWPLLVVLMVHFTLAFTESDLLKKKSTYVLLYLPPLLFSLIDLTTNWITGPLVLMPWGYVTTLPADSILATIGGVWSAVLGLLMIFFFTSYYRGVTDETRKKQTKFVAFGFAVPIVIALVTDSIFPAMNINFPGLGSISGSITSIFVVYGMLKYHLFNFRPEIAAENIFSTMPDSVILATLDGKITKVNQSLSELTGYNEKEVIGKTISEMLKTANVLNHANISPQLMAQLRKIREIKNYEVSFNTKTAENRIGTVSCSIVCNNRGQDVGAAFVLHDITARKEMEQKLLRAERFASIGELAGMLGHDLRNPLSGIRGATYYLKKKLSSKLDADDLAMFESIDKSIDYSNKIINDLLDYSSYYSTEVKLALKQVTPQGLVKAALALSLQPQNITVVDETVCTPEFQADEIKLCRSFINILKNSFDAMPNGGEVHIKSEVIGESVVFTFRDNGCGMSKETVEKLWTPLFTTKAKGMGFGMVICKRNVEAHNGKVSLESAVGQGTTIKVELPLGLIP